MTQENIEAFLSVVFTGSFSKAAESMYSTQTTISRRVKLLEDELGYPLFVRGQGLRAVHLTPQGQDFLPLAEQWRTLLNVSLSLKSPKNHRAPLFVASCDRLNYYLLPQVFRDFSRDHPEVLFNNCSYHSITVIEKVKSGELDAGFISIEPLISSSFAVHRFHSDALVMVCIKNGFYPDGLIHPKDLHPEDEIRVTPDLKITQWYGSWWDNYTQPAVMLDTVNMLPLYLVGAKAWSVCPKHVAQGLCENGKMEFHEFSVPTPTQYSYFIYNKNTFETKPVLTAFVNSFIKRFPAI